MGDYKIMILPGDGIGPEIMRETLRVLSGVMAGIPGLALSYNEHPLGAGHYRATGEILPGSVVEDCRKSDAILLAAIGIPEVRLPDGTEVQPHMIVGLRKVLDLYAAVRPVKLYPNVPSPLRETGKGIDFVVLRENTEGLFASFGGGAAVADDVVADTLIITRKGTTRAVEFAFKLAERRNGRPLDGRKRVTCVDKANVFRSLAFFRKIFYEVAARHPQIDTDATYVDAMTLYMLNKPWNYDVMVMENMFGDILSDLAAGLVGGLGLGPSAEIGDNQALFQPSHGSAPDIAGRNIANPIACILSGAMMLDWLGHEKNDKAALAGAGLIEAAVVRVLAGGAVRTPDLGGRNTCSEMGDALLREIESGKLSPGEGARRG
jgi:3-isopropylmalate dehydrogenase